MWRDVDSEPPPTVFTPCSMYLVHVCACGGDRGSAERLPPPAQHILRSDCATFIAGVKSIYHAALRGRHDKSIRAVFS